jgi:hypothetical protein
MQIEHIQAAQSPEHFQRVPLIVLHFSFDRFMDLSHLLLITHLSTCGIV